MPTTFFCALTKIPMGWLCLVFAIRSARRAFYRFVANCCSMPAFFLCPDGHFASRNFVDWLLIVGIGGVGAAR